MAIRQNPNVVLLFFFGSNTVFPTTYRMSFTKIRFYLTKHLIYYDIYSHNSIQSLKRVLALFKSHKRLSYVTWIYTDCGKIADFLQKTRLNIFKNMLIRQMTFSGIHKPRGGGGTRNVNITENTAGILQITPASYYFAM